MKKYKVIIIGNGMVGHRIIQHLSEFDNKNIEIITFSEEEKLAYDRVQLSSYFSGKSADDLSLTSSDEYQRLGINYHLSQKVINIDRSRKMVFTNTGQSYQYDKLVIATGSTPFVPPIPLESDEHIHVYRTLKDLDAIKTSSEASKSGVVIGGGLLGLEAANALKQLNLSTHVVEFSTRLMPVQLDKNGGKLLRKKIEELGVVVHTGKNTKKIVSGNQQRYRLIFADGDCLETDTIVFSTGIRPQDELARLANLEIGERGGIVINDYCQTSDEDIYAIGECALWQGKIFGLVAPGYKMAMTAATHCNQSLLAAASQTDKLNLPFTGADMSTKLKLLGVDVASIGDAHAEQNNSLSYSYNDESSGVYKKIVISADRKKLLGAVLVGDTEDYGSWLQFYINQMELPQPPEQLLLPIDTDSANQNTGSSLTNLPETAQICSCNDVSKRNIVDCIQQGAQDIASLKDQCNAGTGCGGCTQLVSQILDDELSKLGVEINNHICAHFSFSRAELFDIISVKKIRTFDALISEYGQGLGCEICKPAVASILASLWNEPVLDKNHIGLQDTNDAFLANMQKDGTYSVVPRVPGGEITPEKLIVIGQVARDFSLYTKITGGQRIDLFGAQLHQLPIIWKRLINAGFETGHAYGKALRTVKSCVGTSWCRFGVQDSTTMAILLEKRYRGIRSPHKIKMAVSGCTRECAEAQSKDFGVIATEKGWNLYVGGNGGMRPRHADLFATDLSDETLISYIDRIMIFYIRTAEKLQRTSVWLEGLEGGLDYLKQVIIEDKLSINQDMEKQMNYLVSSYQCEWKSTIENPEKLKRFNHFINSKEADPQVIFVEERQQIRPATWEEKTPV
ncbi:nitrite reductase large subunit NirB [Aliikangiella coralliicola]|uniref:Nitrite reductase large subunit n=1 Tax=Aliikangiella coralliicola TaxID=2592383 RepID=A0A545U5Y7_9GAMM|nr:nitrite reductase large subunit NirB [Aliikangiella coralliicola]TQV84882.1 nitrite reductase large subunit [Aliikangiella coralliicola]